MNKIIYHGFTLFELLIVISISVLIFSLVGNDFFFKKTYDDIIRGKLIHALHLTRSEALTREEMVTLSKQGAWENGYVISTETELLYYIKNPHQPSSLLHWRAFPKNRTDIEFLPNGFLNAENGTFWFCVPGQVNPRWAVVLSQTGRARELLPNKQGELILVNGEHLLC